MTIEQLEKLGVDTKEGLERCLGDEGFYLSLVPKALERTHYEQLEAAIRSGDLSAAFECAHAVKGIVGNLSLTPLYEEVNKLTDLLREGTDMDYTPYLEKIWEIRNKLAE